MELHKVSIAAVLGALFAGHAQASFTFDATGDSTSVFYVKTIDGADLNATVQYTLLSVAQGGAGDTATFKVEVQNNTLATEPGQNVMMSFGIAVITPALTAVSDDSGIWDTGTDVTLAGFQHVDFCAYRSNNCAGGAIGGGLGENSALETFNVTMTFASTALDNFGVSGATDFNTITFGDPFSVKFQGVGNSGNSFEFSCPNDTPGCEGGGPPVLIPEPSTLALLGLGLFAAGALRRRILS